MVQQLARPKDHVEVYWFSEQPYGHVTDADLEQYESGRLGFPKRLARLCAGWHPRPWLSPPGM